MTEPKKLGRPATGNVPIQSRIDRETFEQLNLEPNKALQIKRILEAYYKSVAVRRVVDFYNKDR